MFKRLFTAAIVFGIAATAPPAMAQQVTCALRDNVVQQLSGKYSEQLTGAGIQNSRRYIEVWAAPRTGTFTVLLTRPDGISCIIAAGNNWHQKPLDATAGDTPS